MLVCYPITVGRAWSETSNDDNRQPRDLHWLMTVDQKDQSCRNTEAAMDDVPVDIIRRQLVHFYTVDPNMTSASGPAWA